MKQNKVEKVYNAKKLVAIVFRKEITLNGVEFFTNDNNPFQVGIHQDLKGTKLPAHVHKIDKPLVIDVVQEFLLVQEGKIQVNLYTKKGRLVENKVLNEGDSILLLDGGHGVDFLDNAKVLIIKQGPFLGTTHAKIFLKT